jgi:hypothetical protein
VRYEALHANGPGVVRRLVDWIGLDWTDAEIEAALARNAPDAARAGKGTPIPLGGAFGQVSGPVVKEPPGFVRRGKSGAWQQDLRPLDRLAIWRVAHEVMAEVGYPWSAPWSA